MGALVPAVTAIAGLGSAAAGIAAATKKAPDLPKPPDPIAMPDPEADQAARRRRIASEMQRSGRMSTFLSGADRRDTLG